LLTKMGEAVSFWVDEEHQVHVVERLKGVEFKAPGNRLREEGWRCVGPGLEFVGVLKDTGF
jgi:hypothetical protein